MLAIGEIHTCLLHNSTALSRISVLELLELLPGQPVQYLARPVSRAVSPDVMTSVDCRLATIPQTKTKTRGVGTVSAHAVVTGGRLLQSSVTTKLQPAKRGVREQWAYYTRRAQMIDIIGPGGAAELSTGFLADESPASTLDLASIGNRLLTNVQTRPQLDSAVWLRVRPTRVRWAARIGAVETPIAEINRRTDVIRTIELTVPKDDVECVARFCEDFALHDWLMTALEQLMDDVERAKRLNTDYVDTLVAILDGLAHLWMPGVYEEPPLRGLWESLERWPGYSRTWRTTTAHVRDQIALHTLREIQSLRAARA